MKMSHWMHGMANKWTRIYAYSYRCAVDIHTHIHYTRAMSIETETVIVRCHNVIYSFFFFFHSFVGYRLASYSPQPFDCQHTFLRFVFISFLFFLCGISVVFLCSISMSRQGYEHNHKCSVLHCACITCLFVCIHFFPFRKCCSIAICYNIQAFYKFYPCFFVFCGKYNQNNN